MNNDDKRKLIFYLIAENLPQKLEKEDAEEYQRESAKLLKFPTVGWTYATFLGIFVPTMWVLVRQPRVSLLRDLCLVGAVAGYSATVVNSLMWRTCEGRLLAGSRVLDKLVLFGL